MLNVAIIEDDPNMREMLRIHLSGIGLALELFEDAAAGIRAILAKKPDLVLLDLVLPDLGGLEVLNALKSDESTRTLPVIVITSMTNDETFAEATRLGVDAFLTKPIQRDVLIKTVLGQIAKRVQTAPRKSG